MHSPKRPSAPREAPRTRARLRIQQPSLGRDSQPPLTAHLRLEDGPGDPVMDIPQVIKVFGSTGHHSPVKPASA